MAYITSPFGPWTNNMFEFREISHCGQIELENLGEI